MVQRASGFRRQQAESVDFRPPLPGGILPESPFRPDRIFVWLAGSDHHAMLPAACCPAACWLSAPSIYSLLVVPGSILPAARNPAFALCTISIDSSASPAGLQAAARKPRARQPAPRRQGKGATDRTQSVLQGLEGTYGGPCTFTGGIAAEGAEALWNRGGLVAGGWLLA
eukprot:COSAG01_NODE_31169_length_602_cov_2.715706_1_plen_169_part_10